MQNSGVRSPGADNPPPDLFDVESYDYDLPEDRIAQNPAERRDASRLMHLTRAGGGIAHRTFSDLPALLRADDVLVLNDTRVLCARLLGEKIGEGRGPDAPGAQAEVLCLSQPDAAREPDVWRALVRPGRKLPPGTRVRLAGGHVVEIGARIEDGMRLVRLSADIPQEALFERCGRLPLPPYIKQTRADDARYQTVYADAAKRQSVAAPTAGLHFTEALLDELRAMGVETEYVTLDVGIGTFRPMKVRDVREHRMHSERCRIGAEQAERLNRARAAGRRIVAVGTTSVRTLESFAGAQGRIAAGERETDIFIRPGYAFRAVDALITNFHLPRSTLLMLVAAFAGYAYAMRAYAEAVRSGYRFFSFGDAMLIE